jgi:hypothetical protein
MALRLRRSESPQRSKTASYIGPEASQDIVNTVMKFQIT